MGLWSKAKKAARKAKRAAEKAKRIADEKARKAKEAAEKAKKTIEKEAKRTAQRLADEAKRLEEKAKKEADELKKEMEEKAKAAIEETKAAMEEVKGGFDKLINEIPHIDIVTDNIKGISDLPGMDPSAMGMINERIDLVKKMTANIPVVGASVEKLDELKQETQGVVNDIIANVKEEMLKAILRKKALEAIEDKRDLLEKIIEYHIHNPEFPKELVEEIEKIAPIVGLPKGESVHNYPYMKDLRSCVSFSVTGSGSKIIGAGCTLGIAANIKDYTPIISGELELTTPGPDYSLELGLWAPDPMDMEGPYWGIYVGAADFFEKANLKGFGVYFDFKFDKVIGISAEFGEVDKPDASIMSGFTIVRMDRE